MKAFAKRTTLLIVLVAVAIAWVLLMSINTSKSAGATGGDGSRAGITYIDEAEFPRVTAYLSLLDGAGRPLTGLDQAAFTLTEDGKEAPIEALIGAGQQPIVAVLTIDHSGSMSDAGKMSGAQQAARTFLDQLQPGRDRVGVIAFDHRLSSLYDLSLISEADRRALQGSISALMPDGQTAYYDAVYDALGSLKSVPGRKVVLAMTDGGDNQSRHSLSNTIAYAREYKIPVFTIGLGQSLKESALKEMAQETGGRYYFSPDAGQLAALYKELAENLQNEYSLTYESPTPRRDGTQRAVAVTVRHPGATLEASGAYNPGGVISVSLNLPLLIGLGALLVGLIFLPGVLAKARRGARQAPLAGPGPAAQPQADYRPGMDYPPPVPPPPYAPPAYPSPQTAQPAAPGYPPVYPGTQPAQPASGYPPAQPAGQGAAPPTTPVAGFGYTPGPATPAQPPVSAAGRCVYCGASIRVGARFCGACGRPQPVQ